MAQEPEITKVNQDQPQAASPDQSSGIAPAYEPKFPRTRWQPEGREFDMFFDRFVPSQYDVGFGWRCKNLKGQAHRYQPFETQDAKEHVLIAGNAETMLLVFQATPVADLDRMRAAGKEFYKRATINPGETFDFDLPDLLEPMTRQLHAKWLAQFTADLEAGRRTDADHPGAVEFDKRPPSEFTLLNVQVWANWRVLGSLSDEDYALVRGTAERSQSASKLTE